MNYPSIRLSGRGYAALADTALSYTWGDPSDAHQVGIGSNVLLVWQNLFPAHQELREKEGGTGDRVAGPSTVTGKRATRFISKATAARDEIYRILNAGFASLGDDVSEEPEQIYESYGSDRRYEKAWSAVAQLYEQPYWRRTWIIQELACVKEATLH
ncbi:hypothetical protein F5X98DRAFT_375048 [Xylaria grammica]|nr:hypothetical protein F5X98DRAFT_375048 [Xylaria grammica]